MWTGTRMACAATLLLFAATPLSAQRGAVELGMDAMLAWHDIDGMDENLLEIAGPIGGFTSFAPVQGLRAGFFLSDQFSLEPSLGFNFLDEGDESVTRLGLSVTTLYFTSPNGQRNQPFLAIGGSFTTYDYSDSDAFNQFGAHGLVGVKMPVADRLAVRLAAGGGHFFENDDMEARWTVLGTVGVSYTVGGSMRVAAR